MKPTSDTDNLAARPLVLYHADCMDGLVAAWVLWRSRAWAGGEFVAVRYGDPPPIDLARGRDVVVLDFSYSREDTIALARAAGAFRLLDHHQTAADRLAGLPECTVDMTKSGARLAWWMESGSSGSAPWIVDYVEDRDLWRWELPHSREVNAWLGARCRTFEDLEAVHRQGPTAAREAGVACLVMIQRYVESAAAEAQRSYMLGHVVPVVNASRPHVSELLEHLAAGHPFAAAWHRRADGATVYSLRSSKGGIDVGALATRVGGGGRQHTAGFTVPRGHVPMHVPMYEMKGMPEGR